jgi:hypothetical protein
MRDTDYKDAAIRRIFTGTRKTISGDIELNSILTESNPAGAGPVDPTVPQWLEHRLQRMLGEAMQEPLPARFVRVLRQLEAGEHR